MERHPFHDLRIAVKWCAIGAAVAYLFDPQQGRTRRAKLTDMGAAQARQAGRRTQQQAKHLANRAKGRVHEARKQQLAHDRSPEGPHDGLSGNGRSSHPLANI